MPRPKKKEIKLDQESVLALLQEVYNECVEQRTTAIRIQNKMLGLDTGTKHFVARSLRQGSPMYGATWKDEGLNRVIAQIAKGVGHVHFESRVLLRFMAERCGLLKRKACD